MSALGKAQASRLVSILKNPTAREKDTALKAHLLNTFELSYASSLFSLQGLGDGKPSVLMDRMLDLLGEQGPDFLFFQLFLRQLPSQVRAALANTTITDCRRLAEVANMFFLASQGHCVAVLFPVHIAPVTLDDSTLIAATTSCRQQSSDPSSLPTCVLTMKSLDRRLLNVVCHAFSAGKEVAMSIGPVDRLLFIFISISR